MDKIIVFNESWGDAWDPFKLYRREGDESVDAPEKIERMFKKRALAGIDRVLWRSGRFAYETERYFEQDTRTKAIVDCLESIKKKMDILRWPVECAHNAGVKIYVRFDPYNLGGPPEYGYDLQAVFVKEHPEYLVVDRTLTKRHWGILEWAYPEAREYIIDGLEKLVDEYDYDGVYLDTRTECKCIDYADQYGFNAPIVKEYLNRYGVNILNQNFELDKWRRLRGEYLTLLFKEVKDLLSERGKRFAVGTVRGNYVGAPIGNLYVDWQKWVNEQIINELYLDMHGWCWTTGLGAKVKGYGYLIDYADNIGLNPLEDDLKNVYEPVFKNSKCELFIGENKLPEGRDEKLKFLEQFPFLTGLLVEGLGDDPAQKAWWLQK